MPALPPITTTVCPASSGFAPAVTRHLRHCPPSAGAIGVFGWKRHVRDVHASTTRPHRRSPRSSGRAGWCRRAPRAGRRARMASVACCSHSPASGPRAYAPVSVLPSLSRVRKPVRFGVDVRVGRRLRHLRQGRGDARRLRIERADRRRLRIGVDDTGDRVVVGRPGSTPGCCPRRRRPRTRRRG